MPLADMPLEKLHEYQGRNPKPHDFETFWDDTLSQMDAHDPRVELVPYAVSAPFAECFHLYFDGLNGSRVHAKYLRPKNASSSSCAAVLMFHGYSGNSGDWISKLSYVARGQSVLALDCRGQGGLSEDRSEVSGTTHSGHIIRGLADALEGRPEKMYFREVFCDTALLARIAMCLDEVDAGRIGAMGGSQGGALTLACAALEPRVQKAAPVYPFLCDYQRVWEMDLASGAYAELKTFFRHFDPRHEKEEAIWNALGYIDNQHLAPRIRAQVLMFVGLMDTICPPSTQFAAYNRIPSEKNLVIYPDFGHEGLPGESDATYEFFADL